MGGVLQPGRAESGQWQPHGRPEPPSHRHPRLEKATDLGRCRKITFIGTPSTQCSPSIRFHSIMLLCLGPWQRGFQWKLSHKANMYTRPGERRLGPRLHRQYCRKVYKRLTLGVNSQYTNTKRVYLKHYWPYNSLVCPMQIIKHNSKYTAMYTGMIPRPHSYCFLYYFTYLVSPIYPHTRT